MMDRSALIIHITICLVAGGVISYFSSANWFAASFWVSAALYINGSIAYVEDGLPGGFDNPNGQDTPEYARGRGASWFALKSLGVAVALAMAGAAIQWYL